MSAISVVAATTDAERTVAVLAVWLAAAPHVGRKKAITAVLVAAGVLASGLVAPLRERLDD